MKRFLALFCVITLPLIAGVTAGVFPWGISSPTNGQVLTYNGTTSRWENASAASGGVTSVSVVTANGFSGTVANPTTTPAITLSASALTGITSITALTNTALTLATLDNNKDINLAPHGTGRTNSTGPLLFGIAAGDPYTQMVFKQDALYNLKLGSIVVGNAFEWENGGGAASYYATNNGATLGLTGKRWGSLYSSGSIYTGDPTGGTGAAWKLGTLVTGLTLTTLLTQGVEVDVGGTKLYFLTANRP